MFKMYNHLLHWKYMLAFVLLMRDTSICFQLHMYNMTLWFTIALYDLAMNFLYAKIWFYQDFGYGPKWIWPPWLGILFKVGPQIKIVGKNRFNVSSKDSRQPILIWSLQYLLIANPKHAKIFKHAGWAALRVAMLAFPRLHTGISRQLLDGLTVNVAQT